MCHPNSFNAHHAPIGAFSSFTLGFEGASGGLGLELDGPANESVFIGAESATEPGTYQALPFFAAPKADASEDYDVEGLSEFSFPATLRPYDKFERAFGAATDTFQAEDLAFTIFSPVQSVPDPASAAAAELKEVLVPAVVAELTLDNRAGTRPRKLFFGYAGSDRRSKMRVWNTHGLVGIAQGGHTAVATDATDAKAGTAWQVEAILNARHEQAHQFMLGSIGLLYVEVPAGAVRTIRLAISFFQEGTATTGLTTRYLYRRWFDQVEEVAAYALEKAEAKIKGARAFDAWMAKTFSAPRHFMVAQSIRSYFGATQLLERADGKPLWIVHEGEYRMMNTFDLIVDQAFFELALNPWTVKNELDFYTERYSYVDSVCFPNDSTRYPGGISFTHDVGVANNFSKPGWSGYEVAGLKGCFSFMSGEELCNWALTAALYVARTGDEAWVKANRSTLLAVSESLVNRDHPDPAQRNGIMGLDSSRCEGGSEITTYDSLDASLGQARNNVYLGVKWWATYLLLEGLLTQAGESEAATTMADQAARCASTLVAAVGPDGCLPAVLSEDVSAKVIPAIEGLLYPYMVGRKDVLSPDGPFGDLRRLLETHFRKVLGDGCRFPDGGWQLSATSKNSWLSKIYLAQFVSERIFGDAPDLVADQAHANWLLDPRNAYFAFSDQMLDGVAVGSRYYPRGVTSLLWAASEESPLESLAAQLNPDGVKA